MIFWKIVFVKNTDLIDIFSQSSVWPRPIWFWKLQKCIFQVTIFVPSISTKFHWLSPNDRYVVVQKLLAFGHAHFHRRGLIGVWVMGVEFFVTWKFTFCDLQKQLGEMVFPWGLLDFPSTKFTKYQKNAVLFLTQERLTPSQLFKWNPLLSPYPFNFF